MWTWYGGPLPEPDGRVTRLRDRDSTEAYIRRAVAEAGRRGASEPAAGPRPGRLEARLRRLWSAIRAAGVRRPPSDVPTS